MLVNTYLAKEHFWCWNSFYFLQYLLFAYCILFHFIVLYCILFYFILFCSILSELKTEKEWNPDKDSLFLMHMCKVRHEDDWR